jgi:hypothetical protein
MKMSAEAKQPFGYCDETATSGERSALVMIAHSDRYRIRSLTTTTGQSSIVMLFRYDDRHPGADLLHKLVWFARDYCAGMQPSPFAGRSFKTRRFLAATLDGSFIWFSEQT